MGLNHPRDLGAWFRWQSGRSPLRHAKTVVTGRAPTSAVVAVRGTAPRILFALDSTKPTSLASLVRPLEFLQHESVAVLAPADIREHLPGGPWQLLSVQGESVPEPLADARVVASSGHYLPMGALAYAWSLQVGARFNVVQHGLMTPHAPPLPENAHLLAFSHADAEFWRSGRGDITWDVVGSQLLWTAGSQGTKQVIDEDARPVFLGQLHGAELPRSGFARAATRFCIATGATYRPHPSETDRLSRLQHALWERRGVKLDRSRIPLAELNAPVVSVFSTGVLEAAARGVPAWVTYPSPPGWLEEFWGRYGMSPWGQEPTPPPARPELEPARAIAGTINHQVRRVP